MAVVAGGTRAADPAESSASLVHAPCRPRRLPRHPFPASMTANPDAEAGPGDPMCVHPWAEGRRGGADSLFGRGCLVRGGLGPPCGQHSQPRLWDGGWGEWHSTVCKGCPA